MKSSFLLKDVLERDPTRAIEPVIKVDERITRSSVS